MFSKYDVKLIKEGKTKYQDEIIYYFDLDGDGNSDKILSFLAPQEFHCVQVFDHDGGVIDQWNLNGILPGKNRRLIVGNYNDDNISEIYTFSQSGDSVLLSAFTPVEKGTYFIKNRFVSTVDEIDGRIEYGINELSLTDLNNDGFNELVFSIASGFSLQPRKIFIYDIMGDSLMSSPKSGNVMGDLKFVDFNHDGYKEIIGNMGAAGNIQDSIDIQYSDYSAWLMVFDHKLNFLFSPLEFPGFKSCVLVQPYSNESKASMMVLFNHEGSKENKPCLYTLNTSGIVIKEKALPFSNKISRYLLKSEEQPYRYYIIDQNGIIQRINQDLELGTIIDLETSIYPKPFATLDLDGDHVSEYLLNETNQKSSIITRNDFSDPVKIDFPSKNIGHISNADLIKVNNQTHLFYQRGQDFYIYKYGFNRLHLLKYPIYLGIFLLTFLLILLIRKIQQIQISEKLELQNDITQLQLKTINNQLDPHFTFNAFNAIASLLKKEKGEIAYDYFIKFSNLVRSNLLSADKISRSLEEEVQMVKNYLDIQKLRMNSMFDYKFNIDQNLDTNIKIPKMTIQNYAENAVKHGLKNRGEDGLLIINIKQNSGHLAISIEDNGIGRKATQGIENDSTGLGLSMMQQYFNLLNQYNSIKIQHKIIDLYDDRGKATGTKVILNIPLNINYNLYKHVR